MIEVFAGNDGYTYARVLHAGQERLLFSGSTKLTIYEQYGVVFVGPGYSYTLPDGRTLDGYTDDPFFVRAYQEMWAYSARRLAEAQA